MMGTNGWEAKAGKASHSVARNSNHLLISASVQFANLIFALSRPTWRRAAGKVGPLGYGVDEMCFRFDRRKRADLFVDTLRQMVTADPLTFDQ
jgi:hypothetical protein